jgi:hypothetical protein
MIAIQILDVFMLVASFGSAKASRNPDTMRYLPRIAESLSTIMLDVTPRLVFKVSKKDHKSTSWAYISKSLLIFCAEAEFLSRSATYGRADSTPVARRILLRRVAKSDPR